ncbi:hypothetical protein LTR08_006868 [Meristemomyces frigidus]|nr:hypothetical protein LTR08_006868 [Meristemomyces frigidus]
MYFINLLTALLCSILVLAAARPQRLDGRDLPPDTSQSAELGIHTQRQGNTDRDTGESVAFTGGAQLCVGTNYEEPCFSNPYPVGECWLWKWTFEWISSFRADSDLSCYVYSGPLCNGDAMYIPAVGFPDLGAVGWLDKLESFQCTFAYQPSKMRINHTSHALLASTTMTSPTWPFAAVPLSNIDISQPPVTNASSASGSDADRNTSTRTTSKAASDPNPPQAYIKTPEANNTTSDNTLSTRSIGVPGGCYICSGRNWTGECDYIRPQLETCYSMEHWHFNVVGFGPDEGAICVMYT